MLSSLLFISLNVVDAYFTKLAVGAGFGTEGNVSPFAQAFGSNVPVKVLFSVVAILFIYWTNKGRCLWLANLGMFGVVLWNGMICLTMSMNGTALGSYPVPFP